ncbi:MAG TPA: PVC-type heme-binding CxxCH protein [Planctomycetota bacterium]
MLSLLLLLQPSPEEIRKGLKIDAGLRVELAAAEPEVQSPVALAFDERGRMWVAEMLDYPNPVKDKGPQGRVKLLEDKDGDGRWETATVFADGLLMVNGVLPWDGGVVVTMAGTLLYLKDTDGDGKADVRRPMFTGFAEQNPQLRASFPTLGLDGWIYVANGQRGGKIKPGDREGAAVDITAQDFRFDPVGGGYEAVTGFGQFGLTFDDWGRRFVCTNRNHLIHLVTPNRYFARNPFVAAPPPKGDDNSNANGAARVFPISANKTLAARHAGRFTASCGVTVYTGDALPAPYRGAVFTCEPTANLVHMEVLTPTGGSFDARPAKEGVEFLASPDAWFRPVSLQAGPDGAFYVVDMCRSEVEHPEWVPADQRHRYDFDGPRTNGRIWRIAPEGWTRKMSKVDLDSPNGWARATAQRLHLEKKTKPDEPKTPEGRARWAWLGGDIEKLLDDPHPGVREQALQLAEKRPELLEKVAARADDPDPRVRWQAALSLGAWNDERILAPLAKIADANPGDRWTRLAVATAVPTRAGALLALVKDETMKRELASLVGARRDPAELQLALKDPSRAVLMGLAEGLGRRGGRLADVVDPALLRDAADVALKTRTPEAIRFLAHAPWESAGPALASLMESDPSADVVAALSAHHRGEVSPILMKGWKAYLPATRREVLEAMGRRAERQEFLLGEIEAGRMAPGELGANLARTLLNGPHKERARKALPAPEERQKVLDRYKPALAMKGDPARGREIFAKNCVACHRIGALGTPVGPDISDTVFKSPEQLLIDILDPSRVIDNNYGVYNVRMKSGSVLSGFIAEQTASSLRLRRGEGQEDVVLRSDIDEMRGSGLSLMPEGLEKAVDVAQFADLVAFLRGWRELK